MVVALAGVNLLPGHSARAQNGTNPTLPNAGMTIYLPIVFHQVEGTPDFEPK